MPSVSSSRPIWDAHSSETAAAATSSACSACSAPISASTSSPRSEPASIRKRCSPSSSSVRARSYPDFARGPVSIETQKHVLPAFEQLIATMKASRRRAS